MLIKIRRIGESSGLYEHDYASLSFDLDLRVFVFRIAPVIPAIYTTIPVILDVI